MIPLLDSDILTNEIRKGCVLCLKSLPNLNLNERIACQETVPITTRMTVPGQWFSLTKTCDVCMIH
jgi:hypothetical protein